jgi:hypothetical protein
MVTYTSQDDGKASQMKTSFPPHNLHLKVGSPVILLQTLSDDLCNGLTGVVTNLADDGPTVSFKQTGITMKMKKKSFTGNFFNFPLWRRLVLRVCVHAYEHTYVRMYVFITNKKNTFGVITIEQVIDT